MDASAPQPQPPREPRVAEVESSTQVRHPSCPFCHADVRPGELQPFGCSCCLAWSHFACWEEHGSCPACGHEPGSYRPAAEKPSGTAPSPAVPTPQRTGEGGPWWVGRTSGCSTCGDTFVVTNRYQRFKCPSCRKPSPIAWILLLIGAFLFFLMQFGPTILNAVL